MGEWVTTDSKMRGKLPMSATLSPDDIQWFADGVMQLKEKFMKPIPLASEEDRMKVRLFREHREDESLPVVIPAISIIEFQPNDSTQISPMGSYTMSAINHLASTSLRSLDPLAKWVLSTRFPAIRMIDADSADLDHAACLELLRVLGECLDEAPSQLGADGVEYSSRELAERVALLPHGEGYPRVYMAAWERELLYSFSVQSSLEDHRADLLSEFESSMGNKLIHPLRQYLIALADEIEGSLDAVTNGEIPPDAEVNLGNFVVKKEEFWRFLCELRDNDGFLGVASLESHVILSALVNLFVLYQEYNLEWALAALDWHDVVTADVDAWRRRKGLEILGA